MVQTSGCYAAAIKHKNTPSTLCLSRQGMPNLALSSIANAQLGAYTVVPAETPALVLVASGSEVRAAEINSFGDSARRWVWL